jgi:glyoxylase-like metal-dependent hydrolase (beta-lactamase superfamily II)
MSRTKISHWLVIVSLLTMSGVALGASAPPRDATAHMERVGDGVYAIFHDDATDEWPHSNTGVIVGDDGVFVIDSTYLPSRARADIVLIREMTKKPVKYLISTHWHMDHNNGAIAYREAFPGLTVINERESAKFLELNQVFWSKLSTAEGSAKRKSLADLEKQFTTGKDGDGKAVSETDKKELAKHIAQRKNELVELAQLEVVTPNLLFDRDLRLQFGHKRIELHNWGRGNSPDDVTIYLPDDKILFTGDLVVQSPLPYTLASWPVGWIPILKDLEAIPADVIIPGHGPLMHDKSYIVTVRHLLEAATSRVEAMVRQGRTLDQIQSTVDLSDVRREFTPWVTAPDADWAAVTKELVERSWRGVRGQG